MISTPKVPTVSLEEFLANPRDRTEWVNGHLITKQAMTAKTGRIQARLARYWGNYADSSGQGGEVYTETSCGSMSLLQFTDFALIPSPSPQGEGSKIQSPSP